MDNPDLMKSSVLKISSAKNYRLECLILPNCYKIVPGFTVQKIAVTEWTEMPQITEKSAPNYRISKQNGNLSFTV
jgi:hypothetical protein